jgi:hypothetical protein
VKDLFFNSITKDYEIINSDVNRANYLVNMRKVSKYYPVIGIDPLENVVGQSLALNSLSLIQAQNRDMINTFMCKNVDIEVMVEDNNKLKGNILIKVIKIK